jgi:23S rRNA pseudouridine2605 synthase
MEKEERIHVFLARAGVASRRASELLVRDGKVQINNRIAKIGDRVTSGDSVLVNGKRVSPQTHVYYLLNKPAGFITSNKDPHFSRTIFELVPDSERLFAVGRLDVNTEGMILLTNDGVFADAIAHPKHEIQKTYKVLLNRVLTDVDKATIENGMELQDDRGESYKTIGVKIQRTQAHAKTVIITLHQGKNRIVRRIFQSLGYRVVRLIRIKIGNLELGNLPRAQYRVLTEADRALLFS